MKKSFFLLILLLASCTSPSSPTMSPPHTSPSETPPPAISAPVYLRVNQIGFLPEDPKTALVLTDAALDSYPFDVLNDSGESVFSGKTGTDRGAYGNFSHLYELDFSPLTVPGAYTLRLGDTVSPRFLIGTDSYAALIPLSLQFLHVQRCGDTNPALHAPCHLDNARLPGGGTIDASGGWHDAGDYIKFMLTTGYALDIMLSAYLRHPEAFAETDFLDEMRVGLDWTLKMWDAENGVLYYQVGDAGDHDHWRMPEYDDEHFHTRPVFPLPEERGANVAGKASAALAMGAIIWGDPASPVYDEALAAKYLQAARELYAYGATRPEAQPSNPADFYNETTWRDDMALAGAELFRATGEENYLEEGIGYAQDAGNGGEINWANLHGLAHYELARLDDSYRPRAVEALQADLDPVLRAYEENPFDAARPAMFWGVFEDMLGSSLEAFWYEDLTGDDRYRPMALAQGAYILGRNPWGVCFVNGAGTTYPHHPHHQIADILGVELRGFWDEGPVPRATFEEEGLSLSGEDIYAPFQSDAAVYHDDVNDYVTNEPTITMNAAGIAFLSWRIPPTP